MSTLCKNKHVGQYFHVASAVCLLPISPCALITTELMLDFEVSTGSDLSLSALLIKVNHVFDLTI